MFLWLLACEPDPETPDPGAAAADMPWVAWYPTAGGTCPEVDDYEAGPLFAVATGGGDCVGDAACADEAECVALGACDDAVALPATPASVAWGAARASTELGRFCLYVPRADTTGDTPPKIPAGAVLSRSQRVIAPASAPALTDFYVDSTAAETGLCPGARPGAVRLTLVDSAPTSLDPEALPDPDGTEGHGEALARTMEALVCAGTPRCGVDVRTRAGLPLRNDGGSTEWTVPTGGRYGSLDWLAQAIVREVEAYRTWGEPGEHLILNLSLGWHGDYGGAALSGPAARADVRAVFDAIRYARCAGAAVFAAAGNRLGGGLDDGPLYPAAWASFEFSPASCDADFDLPPPSSSPGPLVFAVGAVGADDQPLAISRDGAEPQLVAFGQNLHSDAAGALAPITGTSAATAVVAGAVADLWSREPTLSADDVVHDLYVTSSALPGRQAADVYGGAPIGTFGSTQVRRIEGPGCGAVAPAFPGFTEGGPEATATPQPEALVDLLPAAPSPSYDPYAHPQPSGTPCPICAIDLTPPGGVPILFLDLPLFPGAVANPRLALFTDGWRTIALGSAVTSPGAVTVASAGAPSKAMFLFDSGGSSYFSEVRVIP